MEQRTRRQITGLGYIEIDRDRSKDVRIGDRVLPPWVDVVIPGLGNEPRVTLRLELVNGVPRCREISVVGTQDGSEVRGVDLQRILLDELIQQVYTTISARILDEENGRLTVAEDSDATPSGWQLTRRRSRRGGRRITPEFLAEVAEIYRRNINGNPTQTIEQELGVGSRMAGNYVQRARDLGLLPETTRGKKLA